MNFSTYRFTLDLQKHQSQMSIAVFQYDTAVRLYISLTDGGNPYYIEEGVTAILYGKKADGTSLIHPCMIENNTRLIYDFNEKTASEVGVVNCKIRLYQGGKEILTAPRFIIVVDERLVTDEDIDLQDETLTKGDLSALDQVLSNEVARIGAEEVRVANENERKANEVTRIGNESIRFSNEIARGEAETERKTAETARLEAEAERESNEEERKANEAARAEAEIKRNEFDERKVDKISFDPSDLNGANGILYGRYVENGEVHDGGVVFGDVPNEGDIVQRARKGNIVLPPDHSHIDDDRYAIPKGYVDAGLSSKVDKSKAIKSCYCTDTSGDPIMKRYDSGVMGSGIAARDSNGCLCAATPAADAVKTTLTTIEFVDGKVTEANKYSDSNALKNKAYIDALESRVEYLEGHSMIYVEDEAQAYEKIVPAKAYTTAMLKEIGGNTYRKLSENLIDPSKIEAVKPYDMPITVTPTSGIAFKIPASAEGYAVLRIPAPSENGVYKYKVYIEHTETSKITYQPSANIILVEYDLEINFYTNPSSTDNPSTPDEIETDYYEDVSIRAWIVMVKDDTRTSDTIEIEWGTDLIYRPYGNVFEIAKTERVESYGVNLAHTRGWSAAHVNTDNGQLYGSNGYGTTLSTTDPVTSITITQSNFGNTSNPEDFRNGYFCYLLTDHLQVGKRYNISFDITVLKNPLNATKISVYLNQEYNWIYGIPSVGKAKRVFVNLTYKKYPSYPNRKALEFRNSGMDIIISNVMITEEYVTDHTYVPLKSKPFSSLILPDSVLNDPDYGLRINDDYRNYIELRENEVIYHKKAYKFVFENRGTAAIGGGSAVSGNAVYRYYLREDSYPELNKRKPISTIADGKNLSVCDRLSDYIDFSTNKVGYYLDINTEAASSRTIYVKSPYSDKEDTIAWLNGTTWVLALEKPKEIDITKEFKACNPNFGDILGKIHTGEIFVEGGGTVRFCNGAKAAVDSVVQYGVRGVY